MFYLMYGSNLVAQMPLLFLEQGQVQLTGRDVPFLSLNWKKTERNQIIKKNQNKKPKRTQTTTKKSNSPMLLNFCGGGVTAVQICVCSSDFPWFSSNHVIDNADSLQSSRSVSFVPSSQPLNLTSALSGRRKQDRAMWWGDSPELISGVCI